VRDVPVAPATAAFGEISLAGEVRAAVGSRQRAAEASRLGFRNHIDESAGILREALHRAFADAPGPRAVPDF